MLRLLASSVVFALAVSAAGVPSPAAAQGGAGVEFTVVGPRGEPLPEVQVRWDSGDLYDTQVGWTDAAGRIVVWGEGEFRVRFEPRDSAAIQWLGGSAGREGSERVVLRNGNWLDPMQVRLPAGGAISGTARLTDGTPVGHACALVRTPSGDLVTRGWAGADGRYATRSVLAAGEYVVEFQHCASPQTWGWHGGTALASAQRVQVTAGQTTSGIDAALDPAARPEDAQGRPSSDAEIAAQVATLNRWRTAMGIPTLDFDPVMSEGNRLHGRYTLHHPGAGHDEDPASRWFTVEGMIAARSSGLGATTGLASAPFHWFQMGSPWTTIVAPGGFVGAAGGSAEGLHTRHWPPEERPATPASVDWPVRWPAPGMVAPGRTHWGEVPRPAAGCPGYTGDADADDFSGWGFPALVQYDHYGEPVSLRAHSVRVDGAVVESCAYTGGSFHDPEHAGYDDLTNGNLDTFNAVVVLPRKPFPQGAIVEMRLETNYGVTSWEFETPLDPVEVGPGLTLQPGDTTALAQETTPRSAAIAFSRSVFAKHWWGWAQAPGQIVLCREDLFADCLAVAPLLDKWTALLFTAAGPNAGVPAEVRAEIDRLRALDPDQPPRIIAIGGTNAVSDRQLQELAAAGYGVERLSGPGRIETAAAVAEWVSFGPPPRVLLARADDWADAITAGAYAAATSTPLLLTATTQLSEATAAWLDDHAYPDTEVVILGGASAVSAQVESELRGRGHPVRRVAGSNRAATSVMIAQLLWERSATSPGDGYSFVDTFDPQGWQPALLGAALATHAPAPVLVAGPEVAESVRDYLRSATANPAFGVLLGGRAAQAAEAIRALIDGCGQDPSRPRCS